MASTEKGFRMIAHIGADQMANVFHQNNQRDEEAERSVREVRWHKAEMTEVVGK